MAEDLKKLKEEQKKELQLRVKQARATLIKIGVKKAMFHFGKKYPEYIDKDNKNQLDRIQNLFYGKTTDVDFTKKLEAFVIFKETEFE